MDLSNDFIGIHLTNQGSFVIVRMVWDFTLVVHVLFINLSILLKSTTSSGFDLFTSGDKFTKVGDDHHSDSGFDVGDSLEGVKEVVLDLEHVLKVLSSVPPLFGYHRGFHGHTSKGVIPIGELVVFFVPSLNIFFVVSDLCLKDRSSDTIAEGDTGWATEDRGNAATIDLSSLGISPVLKLLGFTGSGVSEFLSALAEGTVHRDHVVRGLVELVFDDLGVG